MKLNFGRRIVLFIHWLASLLVVASLVFKSATEQLVLQMNDWIGASYTDIAFKVLAVLYALLSLDVLCRVILYHSGKRADRGFITVDASDTGKVRIAVSAIEQMVRQAAHTVDGIADMKINIENGDDAIAIHINVTMVAGSHVPTVTLNLQRAIRQFVEMNCGVAVRSVSISIQSVVNPAENGRRSKRGETYVPIVAPAPQMDSQPIQQSIEETTPVEVQETSSEEAVQTPSDATEEEPQEI